MNRGWGLALRKCFCRSFNFELQAAATEDAIILSLGPTHSFPAVDAFSFLHSNSARKILVQALLDAPMFEVRWRWNAGRALAVLRMNGGKKVPPQLQRMRAADLLATVFPDQAACLENIVGDREVPDDPLVLQTIDDCLFEAMDIDSLEALLKSIEAGEKNLIARDLTEPSPLAHEILNANPYAFLDDAPLEERRTQAVMTRRGLTPEQASTFGALDADAIAQVRQEAWPEPRDEHELHDALMLAGMVNKDELDRLQAGADWIAQLLESNRAIEITVKERKRWLATERLPYLAALHPGLLDVQLQALPAHLRIEKVNAEGEQEKLTLEDAAIELIRSRLEISGPTLVEEFADMLALDRFDTEAALLALEGKGIAFRGRYSPGSSEDEWCERGLLARIHRKTLNRLRKEIEPVSRADLMRFLFRWQGIDPDTSREEREGLANVLQMLEGYSAAAVAWESEILPARVRPYQTHWLDDLCLAGEVCWSRGASGKSFTTISKAAKKTSVTSTLKHTPITLYQRSHMELWQRLHEADLESLEKVEETLSSDAQCVLELLRQYGASFYADLKRQSSLLPAQLESALAELASRGKVVSDGFSGLRALMAGAGRNSSSSGSSNSSRNRRPSFRSQKRKGIQGSQSLDRAGRWSLVQDPTPPPPFGSEARESDMEWIARTLLRRYGVVFRSLLGRERNLPPWRELLRSFRQLEAQGEIRGGRFVDGVVGEQFALPEAVASLREVRRRENNGTLIGISGSDPLNLMGFFLAGDKVTASPNNRVIFRDGVPVAVHEAGETKWLSQKDQEDELDDDTRWRIQLIAKRSGNSHQATLQ